MKRDLEPSTSSEFARFVLAGGVAALVNVAARWVLDPALGFKTAIVVAYGFGMATAYLLTRLFVFKHSGRNPADEMLRFTLVNVAAAAIVWLVSVGLVDMLFPAVGFSWHAKDVAHVIGVGSTAVTSYIAHKFFTFSPSPQQR